MNCPQLAQLEVAIREHKQEMVRKVETLQQSLEAKEKELREVQQDLTDKRLEVREGPRHATHSFHYLSPGCTAFNMNWFIIKVLVKSRQTIIFNDVIDKKNPSLSSGLSVNLSCVNMQ